MLVLSSSRLSLLLQIVIAAAVGLVVAAIVFVMVNAANDQYEATARAALTDEVVWPFFDAVRQEQQIRFEDPATVAAVEQEAGGALDDLDVEIPRNQVFIDITVVSTSGPVAAAAANAAVDLIVEADSAEVTADAQRELDVASARLDGLADPEGADRVERDRLLGLIIGYELDLADVEPRIVVLDPADVPSDPRRDPMRIAAVAGLIGAFLTFAFARALPGRRPDDDALPERSPADAQSLAERERAAAG